MQSPPMRGRGLKLAKIAEALDAKVAPHAGAWIETISKVLALVVTWSPPMRGRGLKHNAHANKKMQRSSPPMRGRGLKHVCLALS